MMSEKHYAYLAGLIDGDGCVNASVATSGGQTWYRIHLSVNSVNKKVIKCLETWIGGKGHKRERDHYKQGFIWEWRLVAKASVRNVFEQILPYLVIKQEQADLAIIFLNLPRNRAEDREGLIREIQRLNQKDGSNQINSFDFGDLKWPYLAGIMDAEGTFTVRKDVRDTYVHYGIWARLGNTNKQLIEWLDKQFGGEHGFEDEKSYYWPLPYERKEKEKFILHLLPYLVTKKEQAKVLLEYIRMGDEKNPAKREELFQKCFSLNHPVMEVTKLSD